MSAESESKTGGVVMPAISCPTCRTSTPWDDNPFRPFCSNRCRDIDLGRWASDEYRIPSHEPAPSDQDEE